MELELKRQHAFGYEKFRKDNHIPKHKISHIHWERFKWRNPKGRYTRVYIRFCNFCQWPLYPVVRIEDETK